MWSNPHNGGESRNFPAGHAQRGRFSLDTGACLTAADIVSLFKRGGKDDSQDSIPLDDEVNVNVEDTDPGQVVSGSTYVFLSRATGEVIVLQNTGHVASVHALTLLKRTPSLWVEMKQISLTDAIQDTASHRLKWKDDKSRCVTPPPPQCVCPLVRSVLSPQMSRCRDFSLKSPSTASNRSEGVMTPRHENINLANTPGGTDECKGNGLAQWTVNESYANLEVRRVELDEDFAKLQVIVDRNISYCMFSAYKRGLSSKMDKKAQIVLFSWAAILKAKALTMNMPNVMDLAHESLRGTSALQEMAGEHFKSNTGSATASEGWWILLVLGKAKQYVTDLLKKAIRQNEAKMANSHSNVVNTGDFNVLRLINKGGNSTVYLGRKKDSRELYAIKVISKDTVHDMRMRQRVLHERQILSLLDDKNPYVCRLVYAFRSASYLFLVQEFVDGCDCNTLLQTCGTLDSNAAIYLTAEIVLGVGFLHRRQVVHRDLKPDNILISREGHAKIADFGLSRKKQKSSQIFCENMNKMAMKDSINVDMSFRPLQEQGMLYSPVGMKDSINVDMSFRPLQEQGMLYSPVGTQLYLAPEVVLGMGYDFQIDWWSVGVMLYGFLMGKSPFEGKDVDDLYNNIISGLSDWPEDSPISPDVQSLISRLLDVDSNTRLGANGSEEVQDHRAFDEIQWDKLYDMPSPIAPYFDELIPHTDTEMDKNAVGVHLEEDIATLDDKLPSSTSGTEEKPSPIPMNGTGESCWGAFSYCNMNAVPDVSKRS